MCIRDSLKQDSWDDKETGKKRTKMLVVGETLQLLGGRQGGGEGGQRPAQNRPAAQPARSSAPAPSQGGDDDDIPF